MTANIVLPPLSSFVKNAVTSLLTVKTEEEFNTTFEAFFDPAVHVTLNGSHVTREEYKEQLKTKAAVGGLKRSASVSIGGEIEIKEQGELSGTVGIFYTGIIALLPLVRDTPIESKFTSSLNVVIKPTAPRPPQPPFVHGGYFDARRVVAVNQVFTDEAVPVNILPVSPHSGTRIPPGKGGPTGPSVVHLPPSETGATPEQIPGDGEFGVGPVIVPGSLGVEKD